MRSFKNYLKEEVMPTVLSNGSIDIANESVRDEINGYLSAIASRPCITPYVAMNKMRKMLAYFHIYLPKRAYMEGKHGVEVWGINQFGDKMGMTDQGEFVKSVPAKFHLFFHYHLVGSHYFIDAKVVTDEELEDKVSTTEKMFAEGHDAACQQSMAKAIAPKEAIKHTDDGSESTKKAVATSQRKSDKKLSASELDEASLGKLVRYKNKAGEGREKGRELADKKMKGKAKVNASAPKHPYMEETLDELYGKGSLPHIAAYHTKKSAESKEQMEKTRSGNKKLPVPKKVTDKVSAKDSAAKYHASQAKRAKGMMEEEQIDEVSKKTAISAYRQKEGEGRDSSKLIGLIQKKWGRHFAKDAYRAGVQDTTGLYRRGESKGTDRLAQAKSSSEMRKTKSGKIHKQDVASKKSEIKFRKDMSKFDAKRGHLPEETISEKHLSASEKSKKESEVMKLKPHLKGFKERYGAKKGESVMYGVATNRAKEMDESMLGFKKDYGYRALKRKVSTQVKAGLGLTNQSNTIQVSRKNDPSRKVIRIAKDQFDPTKHVKV